MKNLRLELISYSFREKIEMHPQKYIESLGITYKDCVGVSIADVFMFYDCANIPNELPYFITLIERP